MGILRWECAIKEIIRKLNKKFRKIVRTTNRWKSKKINEVFNRDRKEELRKLIRDKIKNIRGIKNSKCSTEWKRI